MRFTVLDAARGVAALLVLLHHLSERAGVPFGSAFLAVDAFFLMSGFVISYSYEDRLRSGRLSVSQFARNRVIRLFPLHLLALLMGVSYFALITTINRDWSELGVIIEINVGLGLLLIPTFFEWAGMAFPFNPPSWTLLFELWGTIVYAALIAKIDLRAIALVSVLSLGALVVLGLANGNLNVGWAYSRFEAGLVRFAFSFSMGVALYRLGAHTWRAIPGERLIVAAAACSFALPLDQVWAQLVAVSVLYPAALVVLVRWTAASSGWKLWIADELGRLSYGIYILQAPLILFLYVAAESTLGAYPAYLILPSAVLIVGIAAMATRYLDEPIRQKLRNAHSQLGCPVERGVGLATGGKG